MNLFDRVPAGLFAPLTGKNNRRTWDLLTRLSERYFGPDSAPTYADGYLHEQITKEIERFLLDDGWEAEDPDAPATPLNIQANMILSRLVETGWLVEDRVGLRRFVNMSPVVARLMETLTHFAVEGPQLIGGNIQLVFSQLKSVAEDPTGQAAGFASAASLCVRLINSLNTTTLRARDLMKDLTLEDATPVFVQRFFTEHIAELYVRDFRELRTENHPIRLRFDIIEIVNNLVTEEASREKLLEGYRIMPGARKGEEAEALERDVARFMRLLDVERFLERMDRVMEQATQRAIAYLGYRLKASDRIEEVIEDSVAAINRAENLDVDVEGRLFPPGLLVSEERLRMPTPPPVKPVRRAMVKREMTIREKANHMLRKLMISHRDATPAAAKRFVERHLPAGTAITAGQFPIKQVEDAVAYLVLLRIASIATNNPAALRDNPLMKRLGFEASLGGDEDLVETDLFVTRNFTITRSAKNAE